MLLSRPGASRSFHTRSPSTNQLLFPSCRPNAKFSSGRWPTKREDARASMRSLGTNNSATYRAHLLQ